MLALLSKISPISSDTYYDDEDDVNSELYQKYLKDVLNPVQNDETEEKREPFDMSHMSQYENRKENATCKSTYERVIRNLRKNWQMPANYLQQRGYLSKRDSKPSNSNDDLSMDAYNLINGPLLNPSTHINLYPIPSGPTVFQSMKSERSDTGDQELIKDRFVVAQFINNLNY